MSRPLPGMVDFALLAALAAMWGGSFMLIKLAIEEVPPASIALIRLVLASLILFVVARAYGEKVTIRFNAMAFIFLAGLFGNAIPFTLIAWGEETVDASLASVLMGIMPIATLILAHFLTSDERLTMRKLLGVFIGFAGLVVLVGPAVLFRLGEDGIRQLAILGAALSYAVNAVLTKRLLGLPHRAAAAWVLFAGALVMTPVTFVADYPLAAMPGPLAIMAVALLGIFSTAIATLVMFEVLHRQGAGFFGQVNFLVPISGIIWAALVLGERPELAAYLALVFILTGIWIARGGRSTGRARLAAAGAGEEGEARR